MGRHPKPTDLHLLDGTHRPDRQGDLEKKVRPGGEPQKPDWLEGEAEAFWDRVTPELLAVRVAKAIDADAWAMCCCWWAEWRRLMALPPETKGRLYQARAAAQQWAQLAGRFGLTPADRTRLETEGETPTEGVMRLIS